MWLLPCPRFLPFLSPLTLLQSGNGQIFVKVTCGLHVNEFSGQLLGLNLIPLLAGCSTHGNLGELLNFLLGLWPGLNEIVRVMVSTVSAAATCVRVKSLQSCPALCNRMDCSSPGSFVHGFLQTRILEWVAMPSSRGSSEPKIVISNNKC